MSVIGKRLRRVGGVGIVIQIISSSKAGGILHPLRLELQALVGLIRIWGWFVANFWREVFRAGFDIVEAVAQDLLFLMRYWEQLT